MPHVNSLTPQEIGRRLKVARVNTGIRQDRAAEEIG